MDQQFSKEDWRGFLKISTLLGKKPNELYENLVEVMGAQAPSRARIYEWCTRFKSGRVSLSDDVRVGRPCSSNIDENVVKVEAMLHDNPHVSIKQVSASVGISYGSVRTIIIDKLCFKKLYAKWVPHELTPAQMAQRKDTATDTLALLNDIGPKCWKRVVTGDETYLRVNMPHTKSSGRVWIAPGGDAPEISKPAREGDKVCYAIFLNSERVIATITADGTINGNFYATQVLPVVKHKYDQFYRRAAMILHHDNAPAHRSTVVRNYIEQNGIQLLPHPAFSPDLAILDFWLNRWLKQHFAGHNFNNRHELFKSVTTWFGTLSADKFQNAFESWRHRLQKCIDVNGNYFE